MVLSSPPPSNTSRISSQLKTCHFSRYNFFEFNADSGTVLDKNKQRNLITTEDFIIGLQKGLEHEVGDASGWLMYLIGQEWGVADAEAFKVWFKDDYGLYFKDAKKQIKKFEEFVALNEILCVVWNCFKKQSHDLIAQ